MTGCATVQRPATSAARIDVWRVDLLATRAGDLALLSPDERERAGRFRFARHRDLFVTGRAALREILAGYVGEPAAAVRFGYGVHGKPHLADHPDVHFNFSNTARLGLLAVGRDPLGIDVEDDLGGADPSVADRYFTADELAELTALPLDARPLGFLTGWTRKEAYLKAKGGGLSAPLDAFAVSLTPGAPARMRWSTLDPDGVDYDVHDLTGALPSPATGAAALVVRARPPGSDGPRLVHLENHRRAGSRPARAADVSQSVGEEAR